MDLPPQTKSQLASLANKQRIEKRDHPFLDPATRAKALESVNKKTQEGMQGTQNTKTLQKAIKAKKEKYNSKELSEFAKKGWNNWKANNPGKVYRTIPASKAGATKTRGSKWYYKPNGEQLRTNPEDPRITSEGWILGRFKGKELSKNAYSYRTNKKEKQ